MENFDKEKVLARVKKMMALANDAGASEGERDNALRMAHSTLAKYNLTMSQAEKAGEKATEKRIEGGLKKKSTHPWERTVANAIAKLFFCEYFYVLRTGRETIHYFVGKESNVATAQGMFFYVANSIDREAQRRGKEVEGSSGGTYWRSFCKGAAYAVYARCKEIRETAERAPKTPGTSLVLASVYATEEAANKQHMALYSGNIRAVGSRERGADYSAAAEGKAFGNKVSLHNQIGGSSGNQKKIR